MESLDDRASVPTDRLLYQPRFDCRSGQLVGATLYAERPDGPARFALHELSATSLTSLREAFSRAAAWSLTANRPIALAIDAQLDTLCAPTFAQTLNGILLETQFEPRKLDIGILTHEPDVSDEKATALQHLKNCGIRFTLNAASPASPSSARGRTSWRGSGDFRWTAWMSRHTSPRMRPTTRKAFPSCGRWSPAPTSSSWRCARKVSTPSALRRS